MSTGSITSGAARRVVRRNETTAEEAAELFQALASAPPTPEAVALNCLLDDEVQPGSGD